MRNALAHALKTQRRMVSTAFIQDSATAAHEQWRVVAEQRKQRNGRPHPMTASMCQSGSVINHSIWSCPDFTDGYWLVS